MDSMVNQQHPRKARGDQPSTPPIRLEAASPRDRGFSPPRAGQETFPDRGRPGGIQLLPWKYEWERSRDVAIVPKQTGALGAGPGMGHDQLEIGGIEDPESSRGEHFLQLVMA